MSRIFVDVLLVFLLVISAGCGSDEARPVETSVSQEDQAYEEQTLDDYESTEYAEQMLDN